MTVTLSLGPGGHRTPKRAQLGRGGSCLEFRATAGPDGAPEHPVDLGDRRASGTNGICCPQVESELHRKHVMEAWGDQLMQKTKVRCGSPGVTAH